MNLDQKPIEIGCYSVRNIGEKYDIIYQNSSEIHKHNVKNGYLLLSKNDFGKVKKRINLGIFNKKTNFIVGEKNSLLVWDTKIGGIVSPDTSEISNNPARYFLIYDMSFISNLDNSEISIENKNSNEKVVLKLDNAFGNDIGSFLNVFEETTTIPDEFNILKAIISIEDGKLSINKYLLINSNPDFLIGILEGYLQNKKQFFLKKNINIYNFTYILNLLGAQYSIRSINESEKHIRFKLPLFLKSISRLDSIYFRNHKYFFNEEKTISLKKNIISLIPEVNTPDFFEMVNNGLIELVPAKDMVFIPLDGENIMYDLTMPNADATNYSLPGMFLSKNSDGDVLGVVAMFTKDAAEECIRKFSTELKENFLSLSTGEVANHGVKLDAQLGIYTATK